MGLSKRYVGHGRVTDSTAGVECNRCLHSGDSRYDPIFRHVSAVQKPLLWSILIVTMYW